jgi:HTH-type transcriptional regulator/antitoxin MqsA
MFQKAMKMKCPCCGIAELVKDTRTIPFTYKDKTTIISSVEGGFCLFCNESILNASETERVMKEMRIYSKQIDAAGSCSS